MNDTTSTSQLPDLDVTTSNGSSQPTPHSKQPCAAPQHSGSTHRQHSNTSTCSQDENFLNETKFVVLNFMKYVPSDLDISSLTPDAEEVNTSTRLSHGCDSPSDIPMVYAKGTLSVPKQSKQAVSPRKYSRSPRLSEIEEGGNSVSTCNGFCEQYIDGSQLRLVAQLGGRVQTDGGGDRGDCDHGSGSAAGGNDTGFSDEGSYDADDEFDVNSCTSSKRNSRDSHVSDDPCADMIMRTLTSMTDDCSRAIKTKNDYDEVDNVYQNSLYPSSRVSSTSLHSSHSVELRPDIPLTLSRCHSDASQGSASRAHLFLDITDESLRGRAKSYELEELTDCLRTEIVNELKHLENDRVKTESSLGSSGTCRKVGSDQCTVTTDRQEAVSPETEVALILARMATQIEAKYSQQLNSAMSRILNSENDGLSYEEFTAGADFFIGETVGMHRIALLLFYSQRITLGLLHKGKRSLRYITDYAAQLVADRAADFIITQGGWSGVARSDTSSSSRVNSIDSGPSHNVSPRKQIAFVDMGSSQETVVSAPLTPDPAVTAIRIDADGTPDEATREKIRRKSGNVDLMSPLTLNSNSRDVTDSCDKSHEYSHIFNGNSPMPNRVSSNEYSCHQHNNSVARSIHSPNQVNQLNEYSAHNNRMQIYNSEFSSNDKNSPNSNGSGCLRNSQFWDDSSSMSWFDHVIIDHKLKVGFGLFFVCVAMATAGVLALSRRSR